jgi:acyl dehydratase
MTQAEHVLYFDEVVVGDEVLTAGRTITEADVARYHHLSDEDNPMATDDEFARKSGLGERVVSDLMVPMISSGLTWRIPQPPLAIMAFMGFEWQFFKPIRIGDTLHLQLKAMAKRKLKEGGVVIQQHTVINQRDEVVQRGKVTFLVASRPGA